MWESWIYERDFSHVAQISGEIRDFPDFRSEFGISGSKSWVFREKCGFPGNRHFPYKTRVLGTIPCKSTFWPKSGFSDDSGGSGSGPDLEVLRILRITGQPTAFCPSRRSPTSDSIIRREVRPTNLLRASSQTSGSVIAVPVYTIECLTSAYSSCSG
jgi:hypothetical protein